MDVITQRLPKAGEGSMEKYAAFISYRHMPVDSAAARAIHTALETYRLPASIQKKTGLKKVGRCFRDRDELPTSSDLAQDIVEALENSDWLIVVCAPDTPKSKWCLAEIETFIRLHGRSRVLAVLAAGEPEESFPEILRFEELEDGSRVEHEPLAADVRAGNTFTMRRKLRIEKFRLLAPMLGVGFDDLRRRARERALKIAVAASLSAAAFFIVFGGYVLHQNGIIAQQNSDLLAGQSRIYANFAQDQMSAGNRAGAGVLALQGLVNGTPATQEARDAIYTVACQQSDTDSSNGMPYESPLMRVPGTDVVPSPDGLTFATVADNATRLYDAKTFRLLYENPGAQTHAPAFDHNGVTGADVSAPVYNKDGSRVFFSNGNPVLLDAHTGKVIRQGAFTNAAELEDYGLSRYDCVNPNSEERYVIDLDTGEKLFDAPTPQGTSKTLFSPDDKYFIVATYSGLWVYDMAQKSLAAELPCDGLYVTQGYTFFTPDSRFLVLTRESDSQVTVGKSAQGFRTYSIQLIGIPSCRVAYECTVTTSSNPDLPSPLPNYYNNFYSDYPTDLCSGDGSKIALPEDDNSFGVFDLNKEEMLFTKNWTANFISFSPDGNKILAIDSYSGAVLDANTGETIASAGKGYGRGYILPGGKNVVLTGGGYCTLAEFAQGDTFSQDMFFRDGSGRYIRPATDDTGAFVCDGQNKAAPVELEDSAGCDKAYLFWGDGDIVVGLAPGPVAWNAATGKRLMEYKAPDDASISFAYCIGDSTERDILNGSPLALSQDGKYLAAVYQDPGERATGGFLVFDVKTGKLLAEKHLGSLTDNALFFDRDITKALYVYNNKVSIIDIFNPEKDITFDDYPAGQLALGVYSGQRTAISGDGKFVAVSDTKKATLELINTDTGKRFCEIPLDGPATTAPVFSHDGKYVTIGAGKYLISADTAAGKELFSVYAEAGFDTDYSYSEDDAYLLGADIRDAATGVSLCPIALRAQPVWEITKTAGTVIPVGQSYAVYLPTASEAIADTRAQIRSYTFTHDEKLRFSLG
ncbi:MAG: toll/interleukin-1 receptor domain-containing protein [Clostridiales bacterium]|nr:toll/interleukin-1 receptor domain-containing protein [Clostridiales bacterium]